MKEDKVNFLDTRTTNYKSNQSLWPDSFPAQNKYGEKKTLENTWKRPITKEKKKQKQKHSRDEPKDVRIGKKKRMNNQNKIKLLFLPKQWRKFWMREDIIP